MHSSSWEVQQDNRQRWRKKMQEKTKILKTKGLQEQRLRAEVKPAKRIHTARQPTDPTYILHWLRLRLAERNDQTNVSILGMNLIIAELTLKKIISSHQWSLPNIYYFQPAWLVLQTLRTDHKNPDWGQHNWTDDTFNHIISVKVYQWYMKITRAFNVIEAGESCSEVRIHYDKNL